jgi:RNA polymerase sigma-70 factor (ECF subfamily)
MVFLQITSKEISIPSVGSCKECRVLTEATAVDEQTTVEAAIAGDPAAFAELFRKFHPMIYAFAYRLSLDSADAQDIAQETFVKAARAIAGYTPEGPFQNWLYRICANTARDWHRQAARRGLTMNHVQSRAELTEAERTPDFDEARSALALLSPNLRAAVVLVYFDEMSHAEAASVLGCAETTVSWRIFQAKRKLKKVLSRNE